MLNNKNSSDLPVLVEIAQSGLEAESGEVLLAGEDGVRLEVAAWHVQVDPALVVAGPHHIGGAVVDQTANVHRLTCRK